MVMGRIVCPARIILVRNNLAPTEIRLKQSTETESPHTQVAFLKIA